MKRIVTPLFLLTTFCTPLFANAFIPTDYPSTSGGVNVTVVKRYSDSIIDLINTVFVPFLFAVAFIVFLYGVYKHFIWGATDPKARADGTQFVLWGIIGFVAILSVWGLVAIVSNTFGLTAGGTPPPYPTL
jgi:hypothetical protein